MMANGGDIHTTPAMTAPPGLTSNLVDPYSSHRYLVATSAVCLVLSLSAVMARTFTKAYLLKRVEIEDYALIFAGVGFAAFTGVMIAAGHAGQGRHQWDVSIAGVQRVAFLANILEMVYPPIMFAAKFTILVQIKRIFTAHQRDFIYWSVNTLILANFLGYFATFVAFVFACWPREKIWNPHIPGRCISTNASIIATSIINLISDFTILFLPAYATIGLHIPTKKKVGVIAIFATGAFACVSSIIRLVYSIKMTQTHDIMWAIAPVGMWALAEFATVILVACFPTFPRLLNFIRKRGSESRYAYDQYPKPRPPPNRDPNSLGTWCDDSTQTVMGSYIPLEDRKLPSAVDREQGHERVALPSTGPKIHKKIEIEMVSQREQ